MPPFPKKAILVVLTLALQLPMHAQDAVITLKRLAGQGDADAQYRLGLAYASGSGVQKDAVVAVEWHRKAAEQGQVEAQFSLGEAYVNGAGVEKDVIEGYAHLNLAGVALEKARAARDKLEEWIPKDQILIGQRRTKEIKEHIRKVAEEKECLRKVAEEKERLRKVAEEERVRKVAEEERLRKVAEEERLRKVAEEERLRKVAEEERLRKVAEEERIRKDAEEERLRKVAEEERFRKQVEEERLRKVAEKERIRKDAEEERLRKVAEEERWNRFVVNAVTTSFTPDYKLRELGLDFQDGKGVPKDLVMAFALLRISGVHYITDEFLKQLTPKQIAAAEKRQERLGELLNEAWSKKSERGF